MTLLQNYHVYFCSLNAYDCDPILMKNVFFSKIKATKYSQSKSACPAHDPPKYCNTPQVGPAPHVGKHGSKVITSF